MMNYSEKGFDIRLEGNTIYFSGKIEKREYSELDTFLKKADGFIESGTCKIRLENLEFLCSSGIGSLFMFILNSAKNFEVYMKKTIVWQRDSIPIVVRLKRDLKKCEITVFEV